MYLKSSLSNSKKTNPKLKNPKDNPGAWDLVFGTY